MSIENGNGAGEPAEEVSRERAKEIIDEAEAGTLIALEAEPVPVIGLLEEGEEAECELVVSSYRFGDLDKFGFGEGGDADADADGGDAP